jgi:anti-sigma B factor antagonist
MIINKMLEGSKATVALDGRLDTLTAPDLDQALEELPGDISELVLDFEKLSYVSSAGLRVLLRAHKKMAPKGGMKIRCVNDTIKEIFDVTGFSEILAIE